MLENAAAIKRVEDAPLSCELKLEFQENNIDGDTKFMNSIKKWRWWNNKWRTGRW